MEHASLYNMLQAYANFMLKDPRLVDCSFVLLVIPQMSRVKLQVGHFEAPT